MALLNGEDSLDSLVLDGLLKPALQLSNVEALTSLVGSDDSVAVLIGNIIAFFLLRSVAHLLVVPLALVHLDGFVVGLAGLLIVTTSSV